MNHRVLLQVAIISAGPLLPFDRATFHPEDFKYSATTYSASLPNALQEYKVSSGHTKSNIAVFSCKYSPQAQQDTHICDGKIVNAYNYMTIVYTSMNVGRWDLSDLVRDPSSDEFSRFLKSIEEQLVQFEASRDLLRPNISL